MLRLLINESFLQLLITESLAEALSSQATDSFCKDQTLPAHSEVHLLCVSVARVQGLLLSMWM